MKNVIWLFQIRVNAIDKSAVIFVLLVRALLRTTQHWHVIKQLIFIQCDEKD